MSEIAIVKQTNTANTSLLNHRKKEYIVIHYTAGISSKKGNALSIAKNWFANTSAGASADFIVDDETIVQYNADIDNRYCWAVGATSKTKNSKGGSLFGVAKNSNSISIEMCSTSLSGKITNANDANWSVTDAVVEKTIALTQHLMKQYSIDVNHVVRHYDITGKFCPGIIGWNANSGSETAWTTFKERLTQLERENPVTEEQIRVLIWHCLDEYFAGREVAPINQPWQEEQMERVVSDGVTDGTRPLAYCTRLEAAVMAANAIDNAISKLKKSQEKIERET